MKDCIFCQIVAGRMNTHFEYQDEHVVAFKDINPQAPVHVLIIPRDHYTSTKDVTDEMLIGRMFAAGKKVAEKLGISDYRFVINTGAKAGQSVFHIHLHLLGGRIMTWPPG